MRVRIRLGPDPRTGIMAMVSYSVAGHVLALIAMVFAPRMIPTRPPPPLVLTASIVSMPQVGTPSPAPPPKQRVSPTKMAQDAADTARKRSRPKPKPRRETAPPPPDTPKPKKKPEPPPELERTEPTPPAVEATDLNSEDAPGSPAAQAPDDPPLQAAGPLPQGIGLGAAGMNDGSGIPSISSSMFPYQYYRITMVNQIRSQWRRPLTPGLGDSLRCAISFVIARNRRLSDVAVSVSSGFGALDASAMRAVREANPLPPLPYQYGSASVRADLIFELTPD